MANSGDSSLEDTVSTTIDPFTMRGLPSVESFVAGSGSLSIAVSTTVDATVARFPGSVPGSPAS